jgi:hypothetical protein
MEYSNFTGRIGALAVDLGVGLTIANAEVRRSGIAKHSRTTSKSDAALTNGTTIGDLCQCQATMRGG